MEDSEVLLILVNLVKVSLKNQKLNSACLKTYIVSVSNNMKLAHPAVFRLSINQIKQPKALTLTYSCD